jgi:hypothetical protein
MTQAPETTTLMRRLTTVASGFALLATIGCGVAENDATDLVETTQGAISGGWTTLPLLSGWQAAGGPYQAPAVGMVNGIVVFRGALKAIDQNPSHPLPSINALTLPTAFRPGDINGAPGATTFELKIVLSNGKGGTLSYEFAGPNAGKLKVSQDGYVNSDGAAMGPDARVLTILDGASVDFNVGTVLDSPGWAGDYGFRADAGGEPNAFVKMVDGFVRFQGFLQRTDPNDLNNYMFTIPDPAMRPGQIVLTYANIGGFAVARDWSTLAIYPSGQVWIDGNMPSTWPAGVSLEGVSFSRTLTGNQLLPMSNGWTHYSARQARVGKYGDVVRFQGAVKSGTTSIIGTLPLSMRPTKTVVAPTVVNGPATGTITINTNGDMVISCPGGVSNAAIFTSLDGVSFGL